MCSNYSLEHENSERDCWFVAVAAGSFARSKNIIGDCRELLIPASSGQGDDELSGLTQNEERRVTDPSACSATRRTEIEFVFPSTSSDTFP